MKVVSDYTAFVEQASIDELYLDLTKVCNIRLPIKDLRLKDRQDLNPKSEILNLALVNPFEEAVSIAKEIKRRMKIEVADYLTCSIGIADNKLLAKIGSDMKKPDGLVVVLPNRLEISARGGSASGGNDLRLKKEQDLNLKSLILNQSELYYRLKLTDIPGIARRQEKNLNALGIRTLLDLKNFPLAGLVAKFGINGYHLHKMGQLEGSWKPLVEKDETIKSIGHMYTLPQEYRKREFFVPVLYKLCEMVGRRMRKQELTGNIIHFYFHDKDYNGFGKSVKLGFYLDDGREIFLQAMRVYNEVSDSIAEFKLIGVTVAGLRPYVHQLSLFGYEERQRKLVVALDKINNKYGDFTVCRVPVMGAKMAFKDSIGFGRIKEK